MGLVQLSNDTEWSVLGSVLSTKSKEDLGSFWWQVVNLQRNKSSPWRITVRGFRVQAWRKGDLSSIGFYQSTVVQWKKSSLGLQATQYVWLIYLGRTIGNMDNRLLVLSHNSILGGSHLWVVMWSSKKETGGVIWLPPGWIISRQVSAT